MDIGIILALTGIGLTMIGVVIAMMFWVRTEANSLRSEAKEDRRDILSLVRAIENEMKDFHHRLIQVEKNRK